MSAQPRPAAFESLFSPQLSGWRMAGPGGFRWLDGAILESWGGSGLFWYAAEAFADFVLTVEWRTTHPDDNSGVFLRSPPLKDDPQPAIERGYEVQIDERGLDPKTGRQQDSLHLTGAIYELAPATAQASRPIGEWNLFEIVAQGSTILVRLNGAETCRLEGASREPSGHIGLQNHHEGSAVQFRALKLARL